MTAPGASGLTELGIAASDADLEATVEGTPEIAAERAARRVRVARVRRRAGPLPLAKRRVIVGEATVMLKRASLVLLLSCDSVVEVDAVLGQAGLQLRRFPPGLDDLAESLRRTL
jgi:hypothetical protein